MHSLEVKQRLWTEPCMSTPLYDATFSRSYVLVSLPKTYFLLYSSEGCIMYPVTLSPFFFFHSFPFFLLSSMCFFIEGVQSWNLNIRLFKERKQGCMTTALTTYCSEEVRRFHYALFSFLLRGFLLLFQREKDWVREWEEGGEGGRHTTGERKDILIDVFIWRQVTLIHWLLSTAWRREGAK